jgi:hypothetical protein
MSPKKKKRFSAIGQLHVRAWMSLGARAAQADRAMPCNRAGLLHQIMIQEIVGFNGVHGVKLLKIVNTWQHYTIRSIKCNIDHKIDHLHFT